MVLELYNNDAEHVEKKIFQYLREHCELHPRNPCISAKMDYETFSHGNTIIYYHRRTNSLGKVNLKIVLFGDKENELGRRIMRCDKSL